MRFFKVWNLELNPKCNRVLVVKYCEHLWTQYDFLFTTVARGQDAALHKNVFLLRMFKLNFWSARGIQLTCCTWNPIQAMRDTSTMPSEFSEVGGSLVSEENQLPFQMSLGEPGGSSKSPKEMMIKISNGSNPLKPNWQENLRQNSAASKDTIPHHRAGKLGFEARITVRVESGWCDPKFHGLSKTQNKWNTSAHTYSKYLKIS